ncbi:hypothetical protein OIO90_004303 [Microbotryomycetes sp. JL221]|nr:hypothetical protein OIO90_004303 [Microbotryomycetes sp. JL221]
MFQDQAIIELVACKTQGDDLNVETKPFDGATRLLLPRLQTVRDSLAITSTALDLILGSQPFFRILPKPGTSEWNGWQDPLVDWQRLVLEPSLTHLATAQKLSTWHFWLGGFYVTSRITGPRRNGSQPLVLLMTRTVCGVYSPIVLISEFITQSMRALSDRNYSARPPSADTEAVKRWVNSTWPNLNFAHPHCFSAGPVNHNITIEHLNNLQILQFFLILHRLVKLLGLEHEVGRNFKYGTLDWHPDHSAVFLNRVHWLSIVRARAMAQSVGPLSTTMNHSDPSSSALSLSTNSRDLSVGLSPMTTRQARRYNLYKPIHAP